MLINRKAVRVFILDHADRTRPEVGMTRVSAKALDDIERKFMTSLRGYVQSHPSGGKTFMEVS